MEDNKTTIDRVQKYFTPSKLRDECLNYFGFNEESVKGNKREKVYAKQFTLYALAYYMPKVSQEACARLVSLINHATVIHHLKMVNGQFDVEMPLKEKKYTKEWKALQAMIVSKSKYLEYTELLRVVHQTTEQQLVIQFPKHVDKRQLTINFPEPLTLSA
jgi:hypothetical protein